MTHEYKSQPNLNGIVHLIAERYSVSQDDSALETDILWHAWMLQVRASELRSRVLARYERVFSDYGTMAA